MRKLCFITFIILLFCTVSYAALEQSSCGIHDTVTGLEWYPVIYGELTYAEAYATADGLTACGYTDWRLPTSTELLAIVDTTNYPTANRLLRMHNYSIRNLTLWTSTEDPKADDYVEALQDRYILVFFEDGEWLTSSGKSHHSAMFVRDYPSATNAIFWDSGGDELLWTTAGDTIEWN